MSQQSSHESKKSRQILNSEKKLLISRPCWRLLPLEWTAKPLPSGIFRYKSAMPNLHPKVDEYISSASEWGQELMAVREILLDTELAEDFKWRSPCYTHGGKNIVNVGTLKACVAIGFFKGALLQDPDGVLTKPGENCRSVRRISATSTQQIAKLERTLKSYVEEAIHIEQSGQKVDLGQGEELERPEELQTKFNEIPDFAAAFNALTPGRQRAYLLYFAAAKQSATRTARIEKYVDRILDGKGINDCICGLSKRMPGCDGSHKSLG